MKILCLSDTHGYHRKLEPLPEADVVVHSGDFSHLGNVWHTEDFLDWFRSLPIRHKVLIAGNHDIEFYQNWQFSQAGENKKLPFDLEGIHYLMDDSVVLDGIKFYGSPWQPEFCDMAFNLPRSGFELEQAWSKIPSDTQVLLTHTPPSGMLDQTRSGFHAGCEHLAVRIQQLRQLKLHVFGHIHEATGTADENGVTFVNAFKFSCIEI
ncbi:metallophosphatase domain-containing protein [Thiomicrorhabdus chilensis]|uniref:metallophosphatase domain-containing protein n=1 Tax=Thiomicrorhabdus chilensis TaxID=63656 RepID=UPI0003FBE41A|nr:metallophosphatase domain-containing protein [Thiomicrorhabdus chilensis]